MPKAKIKTALATATGNGEQMALPIAPAPKATDLRVVSFAQLVLSSDNPRKTYDEAALREFADNIRAKGILQSLLVRAGKGDTFEVIAGQRRYRAAEMLIKDGVWTKDEPRFPVRIDAAGSDADALVSAIVENNQREDINPMEEAQAFAKLHAIDKKTYSTENIAALIGRTPRYVQKRIALTARLGKKAQEALRDGAITVAQASAITLAPSQSEQEEVLRGIKNGWGDFDTEADIREHFLGERPLLANAIFDRALYTGEVLIDEDDPKNNRAADAGLFERLQREAVEAKRAELEAAGIKAVVFDADKNQNFYEWEWTRDGKTGSTVIELKNDLEVKIHKGVKRKHAAEPSSSGRKSSIGASAKAKTEPWTKTHLALCRRVKTAALQRAVAVDGLTAMRLVILSVIETGHWGAREPLAFRTSDRSLDDHATAPELIDTVAEILAKIGIKVSVKDRNEDFNGTNAVPDNPFQCSRKTEDLWSLIGKLQAKDVERLFAALVASRVGTFNGYMPKLGDEPFPLALAESLKVDMAKQPNLITEAWLASARKPQLLELIRDTDIGMACNVQGKGIDNMTQSALRTAIIAQVKAGKVKGYVPRTLRFGTAAELAKARAKTKTSPKKPAKAKKKAKGKRK